MQILRQILRRFVAVVVSSAFWKSLRNPEKSPKSLGNSPKRLFPHVLETSRTVPETFCRLFGALGPEAPGDVFEL